MSGGQGRATIVLRAMRLGALMLAFVAPLVPPVGPPRGAHAEAIALMPVYIEQGGPHAIQVEIAAGRVGPCDSGYNARLFHGWVEAGRTLRVMSPYGCVCYRHTYDDFPRVNWSPSTVTCRRSCTVQGGYGLCPADPNDALFIQIRSSPRG